MESISSSTNQVIQPPTTSSSSDHSRRKRKKKSPPSQNPSPSQSTSLQNWRSEKQQQIYSTKLVRALKELRISRPSTSSSQSSILRSGRAVREVADRALAVAGRGRTRWSRAILSKAVKLKFRKQKRQRISNPPAPPTTTAITGIIRSNKQRTNIIRLKSKGLPAVQRKVKVLSRLVPGCRKQTLPVVLEETTDYIAAMEMQIRAMTAILSAVNSNSAAPPSLPSPPPPPPGQEGEQTHMFG